MKYVIPVSCLIAALDAIDSTPEFADHDPDLCFMCLEAFQQVSPDVHVLSQYGLGVFRDVNSL